MQVGLKATTLPSASFTLDVVGPVNLVSRVPHFRFAGVREDPAKETACHSRGRISQTAFPG
jgi:hypothetical protein